MSGKWIGEHFVKSKIANHKKFLRPLNADVLYILLVDFEQLVALFDANFLCLAVCFYFGNEYARLQIFASNQRELQGLFLELQNLDFSIQGRRSLKI